MNVISDTASASPGASLRIVPIRRADLPVDSTGLARFLVGKVLVRDLPDGHESGGVTRLSGRIVETEAYPIGDSTSHAFNGRRADNGSMFLAAGHAYVKLTYGVSWLLNVSAEVEGVGGGALIRALEPLEGIDLMRLRRPHSTARDLARGPGRLTVALGIDASFDGADLCTGRGLWLGRETSKAARAPVALGVTTRIGLSRETHRLLRFYVAGSPFVSGPRNLLSASDAPPP